MTTSRVDLIEPEWMTATDVEDINKAAVSKTEEDHIILNDSGLGGAVFRPQNLFIYFGVTDIVTLGTSLIEAIGKAHCFVQGNKRTAFNAGVEFIEQNGGYVMLPDTEANAEMVRQLIVGEIGADVVEAHLRKHTYVPVSLGTPA